MLYPVSDVRPVVLCDGPLESDPPQDASICIDNGATTLKAGFSTSFAPSYTIDNLGAKYRDRKTNRIITLAGSEAFVDATSRAAVKSPFEGDVVANFDQMENMLDYVFQKLNIQSEMVEQPVVMTEALCNPAHSRSLMSELIFESYGAPSLSYGLDSLFSFHANSKGPSQDGLVISSSTSSSHVIPVLNGRGITSRSKKLNWGGSQAGEHMLKLMQLKYPTFPGRLSSYQSSVRLCPLSEGLSPAKQLINDSSIFNPRSIQEMYKSHCYYASDYTSEIRSFSNPRNLSASDRVIQFPFAAVFTEEKTEEELERVAEKKKEAGRRLQEQSARQRLEKLVRSEEELSAFSELRKSKGVGKKVDYDKRLKAAGFDNTDDLDAYLKKLEKTLQRARNKELGIDENEGKVRPPPFSSLPPSSLTLLRFFHSQEAPTFPLVNVPDHTLNEEDLKEKRRQRLMKAGYDARIRAKTERDAEKLRVAEEKRRDEEERMTDPDVMAKIKDRKKNKEQLSDRKSLAAQNRMKSIANLASETKGGAAGKKRKRGEKGSFLRVLFSRSVALIEVAGVITDDEFGKNDADWAVYREIGNGDDSDDEEDVQELLHETEARLLQYDPSFTLDHTAERIALRKHQLLNAFVRGLSPDDPLDTYDPQSLEHNSQLHLNVERIRVPEVIWQPHMAGVDQAGLGEIIGHVLKGFSEEERRRLTSNVFVTGGNTLIPNFDIRLRNSLQPILFVGSPLEIVRPVDVHNDAWRGMAKWSGSEECRRTRVTKAEYWEYGGDWLRAHGLGNFA
ncbi:actin-related protein 5, partial [Phenoliferia sp. Uapishka_3]